MWKAFDFDIKEGNLDFLLFNLDHRFGTINLPLNAVFVSIVLPKVSAALYLPHHLSAANHRYDICLDKAVKRLKFLAHLALRVQVCKVGTCVGAHCLELPINCDLCKLTYHFVVGHSDSCHALLSSLHLCLCTDPKIIMQNFLVTHLGLVRQITQVETTLILIKLLFEG